MANDKTRTKHAPRHERVNSQSGLPIAVIARRCRRHPHCRCHPVFVLIRRVAINLGHNFPDHSSLKWCSPCLFVFFSFLDSDSGRKMIADTRAGPFVLIVAYCAETIAANTPKHLPFFVCVGPFTAIALGIQALSILLALSHSLPSCRAFQILLVQSHSLLSRRATYFDCCILR
jgi:hypothetical protein